MGSPKAAASQPLVAREAPPAPVSPSYCLPHESTFKIVKFQGCCNPTEYLVVDQAGNFLSRFTPKSFFSSDQIAHDGNGVAILNAKQKRWSFLDKWSVYRGQKPDAPEDLLFTMAVPSMFQFKTSYNISLRGNQATDFTLTSNYWRKRFTIRYHDIIIAEAKLECHFFRPDELVVTASAGVDRMFISTIFVIYKIAESKRNNSSGGAGGGGGVGGT